MSTEQTSSALDASAVVNRMERLPITRYQNWLFLGISTAWLADEINVNLLTFLMVPITLYFHLSLVQIGTLAAMTFLGQGIGNIIASYAADKWGRKITFQGIIIVWAIASFFAAAAWNPTSLMVFRCIIGIGVGGEAPVAQALLSEIVPAAKRGQYISWMEGMAAVSTVAAGILVMLLLPVFGIDAWRWVFVAVGLLGIVVFIVRQYLPESPRWLVDNGQEERAERTLSQFEGAVQRAYGHPLPPPKTHVVTEEHDHAHPVATLWSRTYIGRTLMVAGLWFFALLGFFGLNSWMTTLLHAHGFSDASSITFVMLISLGGIPGFLAAGWSIEKVGRKPTTVIVLILAAVMAYLYGHPSPGWLFFEGFMMQFFFFGMWSVLYAYTPELYPTRARASGAGWASAFGRIGAIAGPLIVVFVLKTMHAGEGAVFSVGAASFLIAALLVLVFGPETRGKVLETIAD